jgi:arylsulfatase A-like enzyme
VLLPLAGGALAAWGLGPGGFPSERTLAAVGLGWGALALLAGAQRGAAGPLCGAALAAVFALAGPFSFSGAPVAWTASEPAPDAPDVVLLSVDTLRADVAREMQLHARLGAEGAAFQDVQASAPWTLPSLATLHTGLPVGEHGAGRLASGERSGIAASAATLAERFASAGYDTAAIVARNANAGRSFGFDRGFAVFDYGGDLVAAAALPRNAATQAQRPVAVHVLVSLLPARAAAALAARLGLPLADGAEGIVERALAVAARRRERPLFLWLHLIDPHRPYRHVQGSAASPELRERLARLTIAQLRSDRLWTTEAGRDALWAAYRHEVAVVDRALMGFLDALPAAGARGRIVVLTSDHGEEFLEHGALEHGHTLYQELLAVPLAIAGAGRATHGGVAGLVDLAPTLLAAAGLPSDGLPGRDLFGAPPQREPSYLSRNLLYGDAPEAAVGVRRGRWKLVAMPEGSALYDLERDPEERGDRKARERRVARELAAQAARGAAMGPAVSLGAQDREALRELGYVE